MNNTRRFVVSASAKFRSLSTLVREGGIGAVAARIRHGKRIDVTSGGEIYDYSPIPFREVNDVAPNTINWAVTPFREGSGGHINLFRFISLLSKRGYESRIVIDAGPWFGTVEVVRDLLDHYFDPLNAKVYVGAAGVPPAFASVATGWEQAYFVRRCLPSKRNFYFVQDFEPWFYAHGSKYVFAEATYRFGFVGITAGSWLSEKLRSEYKMEAYPIGFSYDKRLYTYPLSKEKATRRPRVFFYARPSTERRAFDLGMLALNRLCGLMPEVEVVLAGWDLSKYVIPFRHVSLGILSADELPAVYRSCSIALVLSMTNLSLLPLEIMACGTPVVSNSGPMTEWLLTASNSRLVNPHIDELAMAMRELLSDPAAYDRLRTAGLDFAQRTSWEEEADEMGRIFARYGCAPDGGGQGTSMNSSDSNLSILSEA